jgi:hypothetical protein
MQRRSDRPRRDMVYAIAGLASCDPRTVERYLTGHPIRLLVAERIHDAQLRLELLQSR